MHTFIHTANTHTISNGLCQYVQKLSEYAGIAYISTPSSPKKHTNTHFVNVMCECWMMLMLMENMAICANDIERTHRGYATGESIKFSVYSIEICGSLRKHFNHAYTCVWCGVYVLSSREFNHDLSHWNLYFVLG